MGISYHNCDLCGEAHSEYGGSFIYSCKNCSGYWICYDCIDEDNDVLNIDKMDDNDDEKKICPICDKNIKQRIEEDKVLDKKYKKLNKLKNQFKKVLKEGDKTYEGFNDKITDIFNKTIELLS